MLSTPALVTWEAGILAGFTTVCNQTIMATMKKSRAIELLGGTVSAAAEAIGITPAAISQWPDELPRRIADRVIAALARQGKYMPYELMPTEAKSA